MRTPSLSSSPLLSSLVRTCCGLGLVIVTACAGTGGGPGVGDDDDGDGDAGVDSPTCTDPGAEQPGNGRDDDCDGLTDEVKVCATGTADFRTIGEAVIAAADGTGIEVCAGTYTERFGVAGKAVAIRGAGRDTTIIDGGGAGPVIAIQTGAAASLEGLTIRGGRSVGGGGNLLCNGGRLTLKASAVTASRAETGGGGLFANGCTFAIADTRFTANEGVTAGGAISLTESNGEVTGSYFEGNSAERGGAIAITGGTVAVRDSEFRANTGRLQGGAIWIGTDAVIERNKLIGNHAGWTGGAIYIFQHAPTIEGNILDGNDAIEEGGGLYAHQSHAVIRMNEIINNHSTDDGGGLRLFESMTTVERNRIAFNSSDSSGGGLKMSHLPNQLIGNQIVDNTAAWAGGGIEMDNDSGPVRGGTLARNPAVHGGGIHAQLWPWAGGTIEDVQIIDNVADKGGGIYLEDHFQAVLLRRVLIAGNTAARAGAGIYASTGTVNVTNSTVVGNRSTRDGGAIWVGPQDRAWTEPCPCPPTTTTFNLDFSVLQGNTAPSGAGVWSGTAGVTIENTILDGNVGTGVVAAPLGVPTWRYNDTVPASFAGMTDPTGTSGNMSTAPAFTDPATRNFRLAAGSVCIDAGNPAILDHDGSRADMGAYAGPDAP